MASAIVLVLPNIDSYTTTARITHTPRCVAPGFRLGRPAAGGQGRTTYRYGTGSRSGRSAGVDPDPARRAHVVPAAVAGVAAAPPDRPACRGATQRQVRDLGPLRRLPVALLLPNPSRQAEPRIRERK